MIKHRDHLKKFVRKEPYDEQKFQQAVKHLIDVVIRRHFNWYEDEQKLRSIAREEIIDILNNKLDPENDGYINYLYTGIRNRLSNELSSEKKTFSRTESGQAEDHQAVMNQKSGEKPSFDNSINLNDLLEEAERFVKEGNESLKKHFAGLMLFKLYFNEGDVNFGHY